MKKIHFANFSPFSRREYGIATVPFNKGEWKGNQNLILTEVATEMGSSPFLRPFGEPYEDGSYRWGELMIPLKIDANSSKIPTLEVTDAPPPESVPPFQFGQDLKEALSGGFKFYISTKVNGIWSLRTLSSFTVIESNPARAVLKFVERLGDFVFTAYWYVYSNQDYIPYEISIVGSNPSVTWRTYGIEALRMGVSGGFMDITGMLKRGARIVQQHEIKSFPHTAKSIEFSLIENDFFGDGQGQDYYGNLYFLGNDDERDLLGATINPLWGVYENWPEIEDAIGPMIKIQSPYADQSKVIAHALTIHQEMQRIKTQTGNAWDDDRLGLTKFPGATGDQDDFGYLRFTDVLTFPLPSMLERYRFACQEESHRPHHYKEMDGSPVTHANHPRWVAWAGQTHFHGSVSPDRLGKPANTPTDTHGWVGRDKEHLSSNLLHETFMLHPSYQLKDLMDADTEVWLAESTLPSAWPNWSTNILGPSRALGRSWGMMSDYAWALNRQDVKDRMVQLGEQILAKVWTGRNTAPVRPIFLGCCDARIMPNYQYFIPWQELMAVPGLMKMWKVTGWEKAKEIAIVAGESTMKYGWKIQRDQNGVIQAVWIGYGCRWFSENPGQPITEEQYLDTTRTYFVPADYLWLWTLGGLLFTWGETQDQVVRDRCQELWDFLKTKSTSVAFPEFGEWVSLRTKAPVNL